MVPVLPPAWVDRVSPGTTCHARKAPEDKNRPRKDRRKYDRAACPCRSTFFLVTYLKFYKLAGHPINRNSRSDARQWSAFPGVWTDPPRAKSVPHPGSSDSFLFLRKLNSLSYHSPLSTVLTCSRRSPAPYPFRLPRYPLR